MNENSKVFSWRKLPEEIIQRISERERTLRKNMGFSQSKLAEKSGVSLGSLKRFETTGKISLESLLKLAFTLDALDEFGALFPENEIPKSLDDLLK